MFFSRSISSGTFHRTFLRVGPEPQFGFLLYFVTLKVSDRWSGPDTQPADPLVAHLPSSPVPLTNSLNQRFTSSLQDRLQP
jgi:hypothetical protein